jgi:hypothetical protein
MVETLEMSAAAQVPFSENEVVPTPTHEMLSDGVKADANLTALAEQVDEVYAEPGLEEALKTQPDVKRLGSADEGALGVPRH